MAMPPDRNQSAALPSTANNVYLANIDGQSSY